MPEFSPDVFGSEPDLYKSTVVSKPTLAPWTRTTYLAISLIMSALTIVVSCFMIATRMNCTHFKGGYVTQADTFEVFAWIILAASIAYMVYTCIMLWADSNKAHAVYTEPYTSSLYGDSSSSMAPTYAI